MNTMTLKGVIITSMNKNGPDWPLFAYAESPGLRFTKNLKSDRNRKPISGAKMCMTKIIIL